MVYSSRHEVSLVLVDEMRGGPQTMVKNDVLAVIKQRRSIRSYKSEQIKEEELRAILEAGMYAPNAGDQAWHFTVVQNPDVLGRLNQSAKEAARQMGIEHLRQLGSDDNFNCTYDAPTLVLVSGDERIPIPLEADCAAATQNMLIAAEALGIGSCWIFFVTLAFNSSQSAELREALRIPENYKPYYAAVFGYSKGQPVEAPDRKPNLVTIIR